MGKLGNKYDTLGEGVKNRQTCGLLGRLWTKNIEFIKTGNFIESMIYTSVSILLGFLSIYVGLQLVK